jgi:hypothetical protein
MLIVENCAFSGNSQAILNNGTVAVTSGTCQKATAKHFAFSRRRSLCRKGRPLASAFRRMMTASREHRRTRQGER